MNPETTNNLTDLAYYAIAGGVTLIILAGLFILAWKLFKLFKAKDEAESQNEAITETMRNLSAILAEMEKDSSKASLLILDAQTYTQTLVNLIQGIALKAEAMAEEIETLNNALSAIAERDPLKITKAAGQIKDIHIRTLMLGKVRNLDYWQDTAMLVSAQVGTLIQWEKGYRTFASNLLAEVSKAKGQLAAQSAVLELVGTARPLLQTQANLNEAQTYLQLERKPGMGNAAKELPAINAGLMLK